MDAYQVIVDIIRDPNETDKVKGEHLNQAFQNIVSDYKQQVMYCGECLQVVRNTVDDETLLLLMGAAYGSLNEVAQKNLEYLIKMHEENLPISQIVSELITAHESIKKLSEEYESLTRMSLDQYGYEHVELPVR